MVYSYIVSSLFLQRQRFTPTKAVVYSYIGSGYSYIVSGLFLYSQWFIPTKAVVYAYKGSGLFLPRQWFIRT